MVAQLDRMAASTACLFRKAYLRSALCLASQPRVRMRVPEPSPHPLIIRACAHGGKYGWWLARLVCNTARSLFTLLFIIRTAAVTNAYLTPAAAFRIRRPCPQFLPFPPPPLE